MSPSAYITVRTVKDGKRYVVRFRVGGRYSKLTHAGSFKTQKAARERRDFVISELAAGRDPLATLRDLQRPTPPARTYRQDADAYKRSRIDLTDGTLRNIDAHLGRLLEIFGDRVSHEITVAQNIEAVALLVTDSDERKGLTPQGLRHYWSTHRQILDFAGVDPNPAREDVVKLPRIEGEEVDPPISAHVIAALDGIDDGKLRLPFVTIEQTAMTIGETEALTWGDVDVDGSSFRLRRATVKGRIRARARWVQVPEWLMAIIAETCPAADRVSERRVFLGLTADRLRKAMTAACLAAGVPTFGPHDLRHRRVSLWHGQGVPLRELQARAGHARASTTLDVYSHVMPLEEVPRETLEQMLVRSR